MTNAQQRRHRYSGGMALVGAGILAAHLVTASPEYPDIRTVVQPVQFVSFTSPSAAQIRAAASNIASNQSTGGPAQPFPINLTPADIGAKIVEAVATAITAPLVIAFFAVMWVVSQLQRLVAGPAAPVVSTTRAAARDTSPSSAISTAHSPSAATTRASAATPVNQPASRMRARSSAATSLRSIAAKTVGARQSAHSADDSTTKRAVNGAADRSEKSTGRSARHATSAASSASDQ